MSTLMILTKGYAYLPQTVPKLLETPILESKRAKVVSCGARHSAVLTGMNLSQYY